MLQWLCSQLTGLQKGEQNIHWYKLNSLSTSCVLDIITLASIQLHFHNMVSPICVLFKSVYVYVLLVFVFLQLHLCHVFFTCCSIKNDPLKGECMRVSE